MERWSSGFTTTCISLGFFPGYEEWSNETEISVDAGLDMRIHSCNNRKCPLHLLPVTSLLYLYNKATRLYGSLSFPAHFSMPAKEDWLLRNNNGMHVSNN